LKMGLYNYFLMLVLSYLGLGVGIALTSIAKEEIEPGRRYFVVMQNILLFTAVFTAIYFLGFNWIPWTLLIGFTIFVVTIKKQRIKTFLMYALLGILFWIGSQPHYIFPSSFVLPLIATLIFVIGFPTGSLNIHNKNILKILVNTIHFLVIAAVLYFI